VLIRPGSSGNDNRGIQVCLIKLLMFVEHATWFRGRKLDYSSEEMVPVLSQDEHEKIRRAGFAIPEIMKAKVRMAPRISKKEAEPIAA
jgi:hypothetical protein